MRARVWNVTLFVLAVLTVLLMISSVTLALVHVRRRAGLSVAEFVALAVFSMNGLASVAGVVMETVIRWRR